ncbi:MAG: protein-glutamate O-methyltransferase CheR [Verrucomicrobiota bacterium]
MITLELDDCLSDSTFEEYAKFIYKLTGVNIGPDRKKMLVSRISKQVRLLGLDDYESYLSYVHENKEELHTFINLVTTHETYFFRTPRVWNYFNDAFWQDWIESKKATRLLAWSAASSRGEEAYSLSIILQSVKDQTPSFQYRVVGSDVSSKILNVAKKGKYLGRSIERFRNSKPELFTKYMVGDDQEGYSVLPHIKENVSFRAHNLFQPFNASEKFHLIFLRNVLIYFTKKDQEIVLANIRKSLSDEGLLIIGESESLAQIHSEFELVSPLIYRPVSIGED